MFAVLAAALGHRVPNRPQAEARRTWPSMAVTMYLSDVCFARTKFSQGWAKQINNDEADYCYR